MKRNIRKLLISNKTIKHIFVLSSLFGFFHFSYVHCQNDRKNNVVVRTITPKLNEKQIIELKRKIVKEGEKSDYDMLFLQTEVLQNGWDNSYELLLPYALILANKYNDGFACYEVYRLTKKFYKTNDIPMDSATNDFIMFYLHKGAKLNDKYCIQELQIIYEMEEGTTNPNSFPFIEKENNLDLRKNPNAVNYQDIP